MPTIVDALTAATDALNQATAKVLAFQQQLQQQANSSAQAATTVINNFLARPLAQTYCVDPINGSDAADGLTYATAKKSLDGVFAVQGSQSVSIQLFGDTTITTRSTVPSGITITGVQPAANGGTTNVRRTVSFLGTATNSPTSNFGNMSAGINFIGATSFQTNNIDFMLPDMPASINLRAHLYSANNLDVLCQQFTLNAADANADALFGSFNSGRIIATIYPIFGPGAAGHLFEGIAAGSDPNATWIYKSNVTSA